MSKNKMQYIVILQKKNMKRQTQTSMFKLDFINFEKISVFFFNLFEYFDDEDEIFFVSVRDILCIKSFEKQDKIFHQKSCFLQKTAL